MAEDKREQEPATAAADPPKKLPKGMVLGKDGKP
jgi:hypothetical protein